MVGFRYLKKRIGKLKAQSINSIMMELGECNKNNSLLFSYVQVEYAIEEVRIVEAVVLGAPLKYDDPDCPLI